jgi:uncharacterized protein YbjT (DUF2867 family)
MTGARTEDPVLVVGGTGNQGGATARALLEAGIPVRALVRDATSDRAKALEALGADLVVGDLYDADSLADPCTGVRAVFSVLRPDFARPDIDAELVHAGNLIAAARAAGVAHFVHTSVSGAVQYRSAPGWDEGRWNRPYSDAVPPIGGYFLSKAGVDELVRTAGFPAWTILHPSTFMENYVRPSMYFEGRTGNRLIAVADDRTTYALVAVEDIGRAAAAALADPERFNGVDLELAGDVLTVTEIADVLSRTWGEPILPPELPMSPEQALEKGMVPMLVRASEWIHVAGQAATPDHLRAFGLSPLSFEEWAQASVAAR